MFFISAIGTNSSFNLTPQKCIELIKKYRDLSRIQKKSVVETLTTELQPEKFGGDKTSKREKMDEMKKFLVTQYSGTRLHNGLLLRN